MVRMLTNCIPKRGGKSHSVLGAASCCAKQILLATVPIALNGPLSLGGEYENAVHDIGIRNLNDPVCLMAFGVVPHKPQHFCC